jgi:hypothetical protein
VLAASHHGDAEVPFSGQGTSFGADGSLHVGYRQWWDDSGIADFEMALPPVGLTLPHKGSIFRAVPQVVLLDEVDTQNEWFVQFGYDVKLMLESFVSDFEV